MLDRLGQQTREVRFVERDPRPVESLAYRGRIDPAGRRLVHHLLGQEVGCGPVDDHGTQPQVRREQLAHRVGGFLHRERLEQRDQVDHGLVGVQQPHDPLALGADRTRLREVGHRLGHVEEATDAARGRGVHHDHVVHGFAGAVGAHHGLLDLAGQDHVPQTRRQRGRELDGTDPAHRPPREPEVVEHVQVLEEGRLDVDGQGVHGAAAVRRGDLGFDRRQRRHVEQLGDALPSLHLHQEHLAAPGRQREGQRPRDGRLTGATLARDEVQPRLRGLRRPDVVFSSR